MKNLKIAYDFVEDKWAVYCGLSVRIIERFFFKKEAQNFIDKHKHPFYPGLAPRKGRILKEKVNEDND